MDKHTYIPEKATLYTEEPIFNCFQRLDSPFFTVFGVLTVKIVHPHLLGGFLLRLLKTLLSPIFICEEPNTHLFNLISRQQVSMTELVQSYIPEYLVREHIFTLMFYRKNRQKEDPVKFVEDNYEMLIELSNRKEIMREAFFLYFRSHCDPSEGWVPVVTLIQEGRFITEHKDIVNEIINEAFSHEKRQNKIINIVAGVQGKRVENQTSILLLRCSSKRHKTRRTMERKEHHDRAVLLADWEHLREYSSSREINRVSARYFHDLPHSPENMFAPIPLNKLCNGATILKGCQHGLLTSFQSLNSCFSCCRDTRGSYLTMRNSSYTLPVYNIPGKRQNLYVSYVSVVEPDRHKDIVFNMPVFLYDNNQFHLRTVENSLSIQTLYLQKIQVGVPVIPLDDIDLFSHRFNCLSVTLSDHANDRVGSTYCFTDRWEGHCEVEWFPSDHRYIFFLSFLHI